MKSKSMPTSFKINAIFLSLFLLFNFCQTQTLFAATIFVNKAEVISNKRQLKKAKKQKKIGFFQRLLIKKLKKKLNKLDFENKEKTINRAATFSWTFGLAGFNILFFAIYFSSLLLGIIWALIAIVGLLYGLFGILNTNDEKRKYFTQRRLAYLGVVFGAPFILLPIILSLLLFLLISQLWN